MFRPPNEGAMVSGKTAPLKWQAATSTELLRRDWISARANRSTPAGREYSLRRTQPTMDEGTFRYAMRRDSVPAEVHRMADPEKRCPMPPLLAARSRVP